ncbi:hypothetical protein AAFP35_11200 [Gordonia sp. CPCC 206044]|uniref:hypothetical protein n=1 Tax=Gordonia sp. CPCC 206044 TaxID=3140793 RepID=UPI003AF3AB95
MADLDDVADELYGLAPSDFVARRNAAARQARSDGARDLAAAITALRRPTQSAWAINQWVRRHPDELDELLDLGSELVAAQRKSSSERLRELAGHRQQVVTAAVASVRGEAADRGIRLSDSALRDVTQTLRAVLADEEVSAQVRSGRLVAPTEYSGFGPAGVFVVPEPVDAEEADAEEGDAEEVDAERVDSDRAAVADDGADGDDLQDSRAADAASVEAARAELAAAQAAVPAAESGAEGAAESVSNALARVDELSVDADRLRAELARSEHALRFARKQVATAEDEHRAAQERLEAARSAVLEARRRLEALAPGTHGRQRR